MNIWKGIVGATLACSAIVIGCSVAPEDEVSSMGQQLPLDPNDPPPKCIAQCGGKACGADDGCGHTCNSGKCPAGQACGAGGKAGVCACKPQCDGVECGGGDGCGGQCNAGVCPEGQGCSIESPGVCAPIPDGQGVECFVFDDGYDWMEGPSDAIMFNADGKACIPDGTTAGRCRKWWGRCRTTDSSHTPVTFGVSHDAYRNFGTWSGPSDAIYSLHSQSLWGISSADCIPDKTTTGDCRSEFGNGKLPDRRSVRCRMFDDGYTNQTSYMPELTDTGYSRVGRPGTTFSRKWLANAQSARAATASATPTRTPPPASPTATAATGNATKART